MGRANVGVFGPAVPVRGKGVGKGSGADWTWWAAVLVLVVLEANGWHLSLEERVCGAKGSWIRPASTGAG